MTSVKLRGERGKMVSFKLFEQVLGVIRRRAQTRSSFPLGESSGYIYMTAIQQQDQPKPISELSMAYIPPGSWADLLTVLSLLDHCRSSDSLALELVQMKTSCLWQRSMAPDVV